MKTLTDKIAMIIANRLEVGGWNKCDENNRNLYRHIAQAALKEIKLDELVGGLKESEEFIDRHSEDWYRSGQKLLSEVRTLLSELEKTE